MAATPSSSKTYEHYVFPRKYKLGLKLLDTLNISHLTEVKRSAWPGELEKARRDTTFISSENYEHKKNEYKKNQKSKGILILDFHNVFDSDIPAFAKQCSKWRTENNYEIHICSFVGRGTPIHASLLAFFDDPSIQSVVDSLIVVFDRRHKLKGKGHIVTNLFANVDYYSLSKIPIFFIDDGIENILNVHDSTKSFSNVHLLHYVAVPQTQKVMTPACAKRVNSFSTLCETILSLSKK